MKNLTLILFFLCNILRSQIYNSSCIAHDTIAHFYLEDAKKLNERHIFRANLTYKDSGKLNPSITNDYLKNLIAVYNSDIPAIDTIVNMLKIHCYSPGLHSLLLMADSNMQWVKNFKNDVFPTGQSSIDSIMDKYYLTKFYYIAPLSNTATLVFHSDTAFNAPALGKFLVHLPNVYLWDFDTYVGEGPDIEDTVNTTFNWFRFKYGWHDCENGCYYHKYWEFRVYNDCSVEYGGTYGNELTVGIKQNELSLSDIKAYPNPTSDRVTVSADNSEAAKLIVTNILGQQVFAGDLNKKCMIDLTEQSSGIYLIKVQTDVSYRIFKILRQ